MTSVNRRYGASESPFERPARSARDELRAPVVLMVSGGADSSALTLLAATSTLDIADGAGCARIARERLRILHVNHRLRGLDAEEDEEFVRGLGARFGIPVTVVSEDVPALAAATPGESFESVAREIRYAAATELANRLCDEWGVSRGAARIVTAHTADDRTETFFMNAIRGSGAAGLCSIPRRRNRIVRPLLDRTHEDLCDLLRMHGIVWREDATNADTRYLRNYIRHEIVPRAKERNARLVDAVSQTCEILGDEDSYLHGVASKAYREISLRTGDGLVVLDGAKLGAMDVAIARRVVRIALLAVEPEARLEARHINRVLELAARGRGSFTAALGIDVRIEHGALSFRARRAHEGLEAGWIDVPGAFDLGDGRTLAASLVEVPRGQDPCQMARAFAAEWGVDGVMLDAQAADAAAPGARLWVDAPQTGEVMCPLGMHGQSKRLSEVVKDARVPRAERDSVAVVRTRVGGQVLWACGIRADDRYKCTAATQWLLALCIT
jgi:tRNA(Ile)-lysidine synthase